ncbi:MAG TPA: immunoglobulin domain-containing protein, partial [Acidimicrobiales bacterium]|nr:immunoglobulin domain-containing protein [Acidimicrobiales bacterium]
TPITGATSTTYTFTPTASDNGSKYEAVFTNTKGTTTSNAVTFTVQQPPPATSPPSVTSQPSSQTVSAGTPVSFTAAAAGAPSPTVQWQAEPAGSSTFTPITGATSATYTFTPTAANDGSQYEAVFTNSQGSATSSPAALTVLSAPVVTTQPSSQTVSAGSPVTFTAAAAGDPSPTVQWQVEPAGSSTFSPISGATSPTYTFTPAAANDGSQYQAVFTNSQGTATSNAAVLSVNAPSQHPPAVTTSYRMVAADGGVFTFGGSYLGSLAGTAHTAPITASAQTPDRKGYWLVTSDGAVYPFGDAGFEGSLNDVRLAAPIVGIAATPDGGGYYLVGADGGVFSFGDAAFHGSTGALRLAAHMVGLVVTPDGGGYYLVGADGGVFSFGDAAFHGSTGNLYLVAPIVGMATTPDGGGYFLAGADGGVFSFGDAAFHGSTGNLHLVSPVVSIQATDDGAGYLLGAADGGVFTFGDAPFDGSAAGLRLASPIVAIIAN